MTRTPFAMALCLGLLACSNAKSDSGSSDGTDGTDGADGASDGADGASDGADGGDGTDGTGGVEGDVVMNEIVSKSDSTEDWIELYNPGDDDFDLTGWAMTDDDLDDPDADEPWAFPSGTTVPAGGYLLIWCNAEDGSTPTTDFGLSSDGETVSLLDDSGDAYQQVEFPEMSDGESYARQSDGSWEVGEPTPEAAN